MPKTPLKAVVVRVPVETVKRIKVLIEDRDLTMQAFISASLERSLKEAERKR